MTALRIFLLSAIPVVLSKDLECEYKAPKFPSTNGKEEETEKIKEWWKEAKTEWDQVFNEEFTLWDEFDIGRDPKLLEELKGLDASKQACKTNFGGRRSYPFSMRFEIGFDKKTATPSMYDWDEKIAKKGIVAGMQPPDEKEDWYLPTVYMTNYPYDTDEKIPVIVKAVKDWFSANPGRTLFLKGTLGGGTGTSIKWCDSSAKGTATAMYRIKEHEGLEDSVKLCIRELTDFVNTYKKDALADIGSCNPAGTYGYPGFLIEPAYKFDIEVKTHVIWGKLFGIGTQTPHACLHVSNGHDGKFIKFRGFDGDDRPTKEGARTMWDIVKETKGDKITDEMFTRVKKIAEAIGAHSDFSRVDIFIDTDTGKMVVNEIESYYRVCGYGYVNHEESMKLMAQTWVRGWQQLTEKKKLKIVARPHARYQDVAPPWGEVHSCTPVKEATGWPWDKIFLFIFALIACLAAYHFWSKSRNARTAHTDDFAVELRS